MTVIPLQTLEKLTRFYEAGYQNPLVDQALNKILTHQITRDEADLKRVTEHLKQLETQYNMSSEEFRSRYQSGKLEDSADFVEWSAFYNMRQRILERLHILRGEDINA